MADLPGPEAIPSFQERAEMAATRMALDLSEAREEQAAKEKAADTAEIPKPFSWKIAAMKSVTPFAVGAASAAGLAALEWLTVDTSWQTHISGPMAGLIIASITSAATYGKNYLKQQAKMAKAEKDEGY